MTLKRAREKRDAARRLIADGVDPSVQRKAERAALAQSFEGVAKEWLELQAKSLAPETISILGATGQRAIPLRWQSPDLSHHGPGVAWRAPPH